MNCTLSRFLCSLAALFTSSMLLAADGPVGLPQTAPPAAVGPISRIAVLGDSLSERGWPDLLRGDARFPGAAGRSNTLERIWPGCVLSNFAVGGAHASGWLGIQTNAQGHYTGNGGRMFLTNWPALLAFNPDLTVVFIGGNDFNEGPTVTISTITNRVAMLIERLRAHNSRMQIVLGGYPDAYDGLSLNAAARNRYTNTSMAIIKLTSSLEALARQMDCQSVCQTIYDSFMNHCWGSALGGAVHLEPTYSRPYNPFQADPHPGPAGQAKLADIFYAKFAEMARAPAQSQSRRLGIHSH